jgi:hypothetical protein
VAVAVLPSLNSTWSDPPLAAGEITWLLVRMYPSDLMTSPDPVPLPVAPDALIVTTEGSTSLATWDTSHTVSVGWLVLVFCPVVVAPDELGVDGELIAFAITPPITPPTTAQTAQAAITRFLVLWPRFGFCACAGPLVDVIPHHPPVVALPRS